LVRFKQIFYRRVFTDSLKITVYKDTQTEVQGDLIKDVVKLRRLSVGAVVVVCKLNIIFKSLIAF
jgi:hypothetical protein